MHVLRSICWENGIFVPTFPIENMKLSELERSSIMASARFLRRVRRDAPGGTMFPVTNRIFSAPPGHGPFESHALAPGGKPVFFFTVSVIRSSSLSSTSQADFF